MGTGIRSRETASPQGPGERAERSDAGPTGLSAAVFAGLVSCLGCQGTDAGTAGASVADAGAEAARGADAALPDIVFTMTGHVDANGEILDCVYVRMPSDRGKIAVPSAESTFTPGSHHFLVYRTSYDDIPADAGSVHPCTDAEQFAGITGSYYEAQTPMAERALPPGVAHVFKPGEVLLMTAHYLNASGSGFDTSVNFRLHTEDMAKVQHVAGSIFFYNPVIDVPPYSEITVTRTCPLDDDVDLALLWSHMHSRGIAFTATSSDPAAVKQAGDLYDSTTWSEPSPRTFPDDPPVTLHSGSSITYTCTYRNPTGQTFVAGQSAATNEMCILHGMYWPRLDSATELCESGTSTMGSPISLLDGGVAPDGGVTLSEEGDGAPDAP
jgi:Copper type II ascorbate-dependent monooxygenase, C-terminal domain